MFTKKRCRLVDCRPRARSPWSKSNDRGARANQILDFTSDQISLWRILRKIPQYGRSQMCEGTHPLRSIAHSTLDQASTKMLRDDPNNINLSVMRDFLRKCFLINGLLVTFVRGLSAKSARRAICRGVAAGSSKSPGHVGPHAKLFG